MATGTTFSEEKFHQRPEGRSKDDNELRILLIGRTGSGKSSTGNTILGYDDDDSEAFRVSSSCQSCTKETNMKEKSRFGYRITVVDTPGLFDTRLKEEEIRKELLKALATTTPGFHVIAYVLKPDKYTEEMKRTQQLFFEWFGEGVEKHALVVLTNTDGDDKLKNYLSDIDRDLAELIKRCNDTILPLDNKGQTKKQQLKQLIEKIDLIKNKHSYFTNIKYKFAELYAKSKPLNQMKNDSIKLLQQSGLWKDSSPRGNLKVFDATTEQPISRRNIDESKLGKIPDIDEQGYDVGEAVDGKKGNEHKHVDSDKSEQKTTDAGPTLYPRSSADSDKSDNQSSVSDDAESSTKNLRSRRGRIFNSDINPSTPRQDQSVDIEINVGSDSTGDEEQLINTTERNRTFRHDMNNDRTRFGIFERLYNWFMRLIDYIHGK